MNQLKYFIYVLLLLLLNSTRGQITIEKLPMSFVAGYGPFEVDKSYIEFLSPPAEHPLYKTWSSLQFKAIPPSLTSVEKGVIWIDFLQFLYQHVQTGNLSPDVYKSFRQEWQITKGEEGLSKQPIACYLLVVKGIDRSGKEILLIDTDHDSNFDDESPAAVHDYLSDQGLRELAAKSIHF